MDKINYLKTCQVVIQGFSQFFKGWNWSDDKANPRRPQSTGPPSGLNLNVVSYRRKPRSGTGWYMNYSTAQASLEKAGAGCFWNRRYGGLGNSGFGGVFTPRATMTSIFEGHGQPPKTRPFPIKTRVTWGSRQHLLVYQASPPGCDPWMLVFWIINWLAPYSRYWLPTFLKLPLNILVATCTRV